MGFRPLDGEARDVGQRAGWPATPEVCLPGPPAPQVDSYLASPLIHRPAETDGWREPSGKRHETDVINKTVDHESSIG